MAAARAAARREAILSSRSNRLAKLTSSARGDDSGGVYVHDDPPLPTIGGTGLKNFVGEETELPKPQSSTASSGQQQHSNISESSPPDWGLEQQQEFLRALMGDVPPQTSAHEQPPPSNNFNAASISDDPISALISTLGGSTSVEDSSRPLPPRTLGQKLIPVLHALSMVTLLVWFVGWKDATLWNFWAGKSGQQGFGSGSEVWTRWASLSHQPLAGDTVHPLPSFFWAFLTLQLTLHSLRLISQPNAYRPPILVGLLLPHLPPQLSQAIMTSLKYLQMGSMVLDDLAILVFGIGLVIFISSNWMT